MAFNSSRRQFLKAGLILPAAGLASTQNLYAASKTKDNAGYRVLGKTGLNVSSVGSGVGIEPDPRVIARAIDLGVNYFDTARGYGNGKSEEITGAAIKDARNEEIRPDYCRMCYECKGQCPNGVPVTDKLRILAYNDFGSSFHQAQDSFRSLPEKLRGVRCSDCAACAIECPNGVDVRNRLIRAQALLA